MNKEKEFENIYNKICNRLKEIAGTGGGKHPRFQDLINKASAKSGAVRHYEDDLKGLDKFRNSLVHERGSGKYLAIPKAETVKLIKEIYKEISKPQKVVPIFKAIVSKADYNSAVAAVIREMSAGGYSQVPVFRHREFVGLMTENGITRWLGARIEGNSSLLKNTKVSEVLKHEEHPQNCVFFDKNKSVYDALQTFRENTLEHGGRVQAILITENGKPSKDLLGIITIWDVAELSKGSKGR